MDTTTTDRAAINRRNAQKSTGPRTPEGKSRSRFNALKHGMTAKSLVLPGEDAGVLQHRIETWTAELQPQNEVEQFLAERSVLCSWQLERADRAEVAQLSSRIRDLPAEEARRQQAEAATLGRQLLSHGEATLDASLQSQLLNTLSPGASRSLEVLDHPEAIVLRLESTLAGCQWMLDRWGDLRAGLDQGLAWESTEKVNAIRLLGKQPLDMNPMQWENHLGMLNDVLDPDLDSHFDQRLDQQLDDRLSQQKPATVAQLRGVADRAIARLEALAAGHRDRAEADAGQQSARLSFDPSNEAERLRRYQASCSRSLFRSLDTLLKIRRANLGAPRGEGTQASEEAPPSPGESESDAQDLDRSLPGTGDDLSLVVSHELSFERIGLPTTETAETNTERGEGKGDLDQVVTADGIVESTTENEPTLASSDRGNLQDELAAPPIDPGTPQDEPTTSGIAEISRPGLSFFGALVSAMILVVLLGATVHGHGDSQNEPTTAIGLQPRAERETFAPARGDPSGARTPAPNRRQREFHRSFPARSRSRFAGWAPDARQSLTTRDAEPGASL